VNQPPPGFPGAADPPLGRIAIGGFGRVALACSVLVLAAIVVTLSGGAGFGGALGALFGTQSGAHRSAAPAVQAGAPVAPAGFVRAAPRAPAVRVSPPARRRQGARGAPRQSPPAASRPAPLVGAPPAPPVQVPQPAPLPQGQVQHAVDMTRQVLDPAAPAARPVTDQAAATVGQLCGLLGGCP
jgi:hypothetical protein